MKPLTGVFVPWGKCYTSLLGPLGGGANDNPDRRKKVTVIAIVVIAISLVSLFFTMCESTPQINPLPFIGLGEVLADESAKAVDDHGTIVPVVADYHTTGSSPMTYEWKTFAKEIKKHAGVKMAAPIVIKIDEAATGDPGISRANFENLVEKNASAGALVFFVGLPAWEANNPLTLPAVAPKIIAVHNSPQPAKPYFVHSIAALLITTRQTPEEKVRANPKHPARVSIATFRFSQRKITRRCRTDH